MSSAYIKKDTLRFRHFIPLLLGIVVGGVVAYLLVGQTKPIKFSVITIVTVMGAYLITYRNFSITRMMVDELPAIHLHQRYRALKQQFCIPNMFWHLLVLVSAGLVGYGFAWGNNIAVACAAAMWWASDSGLSRNYEITLLDTKKSDSPQDLHKMAQSLKNFRMSMENAAEVNAIKDLRVTLTSKDTTSREYLYSVENTGNKTYSKIKIYTNNILKMGSFSVDDTYMGDLTPEPPIEIEELLPGRTAHIHRQGYNVPSKYDGKSRNIRKIEYCMDGIQFGLESNHTILVTVALPSAK